MNLGEHLNIAPPPTKAVLYFYNLYLRNYLFHSKMLLLYYCNNKIMFQNCRNSTVVGCKLALIFYWHINQ